MTDQKFYVYQFAGPTTATNFNGNYVTVYPELFAEFFGLDVMSNEFTQEWFGPTNNGYLRIFTYGKACVTESKQLDQLFPCVAEFIPPTDFFGMISPNLPTAIRFLSASVSCFHAESNHVYFQFFKESPLDLSIQYADYYQRVEDEPVFDVDANGFVWIGSIELTLQGFNQLMARTLLAIGANDSAPINQHLRTFQRFFNCQYWQCNY